MEEDERLWRRALALSHPDHGGDEEVFKFLSALRDHLADSAGSKPVVEPRPVTVSYTIFGVYITYH